MDELETIFWQLWEEADPKTPDFQEDKEIQHLLLKDAKEALGWEWVDKWDNIYCDYLELQSRRFFREGLRFGLKLLLLLLLQEDW